MKPLLPTMKEKKRYLVYELISKEPLKGRPQHDVISHLRKTLGVFDCARAGVQAVAWDHERQIGTLRVSHRSVDTVKAALLLLTDIKGTKVIPKTRGVSGILKKTARFTA
ncbi:hypothetical protein D6789_00265 [Candidatus Woesearchaeota archaeon]|nr:MAG: hypothetical protein D6789_00265 [Candidatus Woesearchaeota archaeon]